MCNRARNRAEPETLFERFGGGWLTDKPRDNRFKPVELHPTTRAHVVREEDGERGLDVRTWDALHGAADWPMTNVRTLELPQWRKHAEDPTKRCLIPLTEFCEWTPKRIDPGDGEPLKDEMWFSVDDQPVFAVAGFRQTIDDERCFAMVTCDPNELVKPIHPKAMITILQEDDWERWLIGSYEDAIALHQPFDAGAMSMRGPVFPTRKDSAASR